MRPSLVRLLALGSGTALIAGCDLSTDPEYLQQTYGLVTLTAQQVTSGVYATPARAEFFRGALGALPNVDNSRGDTCFVAPIQPNQSPGLATGVTDLDAGAQVGLQLGDDEHVLSPTNVGSRRIYAPPSRLSYTPGDSVVVTIPGSVSGYPAQTIRGKTAEAFDIDPVVQPAVGDPVRLEWTQPDDNNSAMVVLLRYAADGATTMNRQVACGFIDDGIAAISPQYANAWAQSTNKDWIAYRLRTTRALVSDGALQITSLFHRPTPTAN